MRNPFWFQVVLMVGSVFAGYLFGLGQSKGKIADLEFDNHILEGENESIWQQLYSMTYGDKSEVKLVEESSLENSIKNHPANGNKEYLKDKINEHFGRDF